MSNHTGRQAIMHRLGQLNHGTAASGDYVPVPYNIPFDPERDHPLVDNPQVNHGLNNPRDAQAPAEGLISAKVAGLSVPLCFNTCGYWLRDIFGDHVDAGAGPYTHTFTSGKGDVRAATLVWAEASGHRQMNSFVAGRMEIGFGQEAGFRALKLSGMAVDITKEASVNIGTPIAELAQVQAPGAVCGIRYDGTEVARVLSGTGAYERKLIENRYAKIDTNLASGFDTEDGSFTGDLELRVVDDTFYDLARAAHTSGGVDPWEFEWRFDPAVSSNNKLVMAVAGLRLTPAERGIQTPGVRSERYRFRCEQTDAAPMITATLTNSIADYAAGVETA